MLNPRIQHLLVIGARTIFILLFVYTATTKLLAIERFTAVLRTMPFLQQAPLLYASAIIAAEFIAAYLLFVTSLQVAGLLLSAVLLLSFTGFIGFMLLTQSHLPCSCGGIIESMGWELHFLFNAACTLLAFASWHLAKTSGLLKLRTNDLFE